ncbi:unnamed protein product [Rotaria socialis]|uniref:Uncharacterized protein n=1 Tax=Rotaria socialis TaxID=392032 RepID=A0A817R4G0_9BILA|nr:unnamed protein product [Rotaria socialis]
MNVVTREVEKEVMQKMTGGVLNDDGQSTGDWGFMNKVESTISGMTTGERNAPNISQRGGPGSMLNELESMAGDGGSSSGDGGMTNEIEKIVKNEFF